MAMIFVVFSLCFLYISTAGVTVFKTPITLVLKVLYMFCGVSSPVETPALAKTKLSGAFWLPFLRESSIPKKLALFYLLSCSQIFGI